MGEEPKRREVTGAIIREALMRRGRGSARQLAEALDVGASTVSKWANSTDSPDMAKWPDIEDALELERGTIAAALGISEERHLAEELSDLHAKVEALEEAVRLLVAQMGRGNGRAGRARRAGDRRSG